MTNYRGRKTISINPTTGIGKGISQLDRSYRENVGFSDVCMYVCMYVCERFKNGDIETKTLIFRSLRSNWVLMDGKLQANLHDWFLLFKNMEQFGLSPVSGLKLDKRASACGKLMLPIENFYYGDKGNRNK